MIPVKRGPEPAKLANVREQQLAFLRSLGYPPRAEQIEGYKIVKEALAKAQGQKCCYCEAKISARNNDVEHYRPKNEALRQPGSDETHGYWWLAFTWENLLFACADCNRWGKQSRFPLAHGSTALRPEQSPHGNEHPLIIDPSEGINPVEHIQYVHELAGDGHTHHWYARPRNGSERGGYTIDACKLNHHVHLQARDYHVQSFVQREINHLALALKSGTKTDKLRDFARASYLFEPHMPYSALSYDVLRHHFPDAVLQKAIRQSWPEPAAIGTR